MTVMQMVDKEELTYGWVFPLQQSKRGNDSYLTGKSYVSETLIIRRVFLTGIQTG